MKRIGMPLAAVIATVGLTLSACAGTPSKDDLSEQIVDSAGLSEEQADCIADELLDADLNDDQLNAVADDDEGGLSDDEKDELTEVFTKAGVSCATE